MPSLIEQIMQSPDVQTSKTPAKTISKETTTDTSSLTNGNHINGYSDTNSEASTQDEDQINGGGLALDKYPIDNEGLFNGLASVKDEGLFNGHAPVSSNGVVNAQIPVNDNGSDYWWRTSGTDLSRMLQEADCPEEAQRQFLDFYRETLCPLLGGRPEKDSLPAAVGWDGNPFEYSFEFKGSTKNPGVRFVLDLSELRPADKEYPLSIANSEKVLQTLAKRSPMFDDTWHRALERWFVYSNSSSRKQQALVRQVGYQTPTILGFDINAKLLKLAPGMLPVMAKSYFPPCFVAADRGFGRFQALSLGIRQMPDIGSHPNILLALKTIEDFVQDNPKYEDCGRGMATDFVKPGLARLKVYMRYWGNSFEEMWDYYTLGGRIPDLDDDKEKLRDLINMARGRDYPVNKLRAETPDEQRRRRMFGSKPTSMYFSLSPDKPYPIPKLYFYPAFQAPNDEAIAQGLDAWLRKYEWYDGGKTVEERTKNVFTYRRLDEKPGIFTFIGIGRKEDSSTGGLSLQVYVTPELYESPRH